MRQVSDAGTGAGQIAHFIRVSILSRTWHKDVKVLVS